MDEYGGAQAGGDKFFCEGASSHHPAQLAGQGILVT